MKHSLFTRLLLVALSLAAFRAGPASAGSSTWTSAPDRSSWDDPTNWNPMTIPNGPSDVATFAASASTSVFAGAADQVASIIFAPGASAFTIAERAGTLTISGAGVINDSGIAQNFVNQPNQQTGPSPLITFLNSASAGEATYTNYGQAFEAATVGSTEFHNTTTADRSTFYDLAGFAASGHTTFRDASTAGQGTFYNYPAEFFSGGADHGYTDFYGTSSAAAATFTCYGATANGVFSVDYGGEVAFNDNATAGQASITLEGGTGTKTAGGLLNFKGNSTAAAATVTAGAGAEGGLDATIHFYESSLGGAARFILAGTLDVSLHNKPGVTTGTIEGTGTVILGANNLTVGASKKTATFSGLIEDGSGRGGSLTVEGGRFSLENANTYTGGTTVAGGALLANNATGSATGPGEVSVQEGDLAGAGIISGPVTIGSGSGAGAFLSPGRRPKRAVGNFTALGGVAFAADGAYRCEVRRQWADRLTTAGVTIDPGAQFYLLVLQHQPPPAGAVLEVIDNTGADAIAGTFANLADGSVLQVGGVKFQASYSGGDGNDLTLTVVP